MDQQLANYLPAIEHIMCQWGKSFDEACNELGLSPDEWYALDRLQGAQLEVE